MPTSMVYILILLTLSNTMSKLKIIVVNRTDTTTNQLVILPVGVSF